MASRYIAVDLGLQEKDVVEGSSTNTKTVELVVDLADSPSRQDVVLALEYIKNYVLKMLWPPA